MDHTKINLLVKLQHLDNQIESIVSLQKGLPEEIDALDEDLVALLARRQAYIERAAMLKVSRDQIRDNARIEDVVAKVVAAAKNAGLSPKIAENVWRGLIEASIAHEYQAFDNKR